MRCEMCRDNVLTIIEQSNGVKLVPTGCKDLYVAFDSERQGLGIVYFIDKEHYTTTAISKEAARALKHEISDIYDMVFN